MDMRADMRRLFVLFAALALAAPASAATPRQAPISAEVLQRWIFEYRHKPDPMRVPVAVKAMARVGAFKDAEASGVYVGFLAGVIGGNPAWAEDLIARMFPLPPEAHWAVIRAVAYSGLPEWKRLLRNFAWRMPERRAMIDKYISGELPALDRIAFAKSPGMSERLQGYLKPSSYFGKQPRAEEPPPELIDTLWGYYFATGVDEPLVRLISMLPLAKDEDSIEKVTLGSMAKYTLASNIARDPKLLAHVKRLAPKQPEEAQAPLKEVIDSAETIDIARIKKDAMAALEDLKRKGPGYKRKLSTWGQIGQGAIALGCIGAAAAGAVALGLPCVVGGAMSSGALYYLGAQQ